MPSRFVTAVCSASLIAAVLVVGPAATAEAASIGALAGAGERRGATRLSFTAGDRVKTQVDVGSGNLLVTVRGVALTGVQGPTEMGAFYNSAAADQSSIPRLGKGWGLDYTPDLRLTENSDNSVTYRGGGGLTGLFNLKSGSTTAYTAPTGFKDDLEKNSNGWFLTARQSKKVLKFNTAGELTAEKDRNDNEVLINQSGTGTFKDLTVTSTAGTTDSKTGKVSTDGAGVTTVSQGSATVLRRVLFAKTANTMTRFTDALDRATTFGYDSNGLLTSIAAPGGVTTNVAYDSSKRVTSVTQVETSSGGPGSSTTRLAYPDTNTTYVASPNTDQTQAVGSVPRITYTLNSDDRVNSAVDAAGRTRSKTYTANFDTASATAGTGGAASTTTNSWGANGGDSLTSTQTPNGATNTLSYANTSGPAQYLPTGAKDDAGNSGTFTYNGAGNQLTSSDATTAKAELDYNSDGTVSTATAPENGTNKTVYGYSNKLLNKITPVTGSSLGVRDYTYDSVGRVRTATNGRGITATYNYDNNDRVTSLTFSDGTSVTYGYDTAGRNNQRVDASGTTTYTFDQLGRLLTRQNTAYGGVIRYTYDRASWLKTSTSDAGGTITYSYDDSGKPTKLTYPQQGGGTSTLMFQNDSKGRRTHTWLKANSDHTTWSARTIVSYDNTGRVVGVTADKGSGDTDYQRVVDLYYCYKAGTVPTTDPSTGCTGPTTADRRKLVWKRDNLGQYSTTYSYDKAGRLTRAAVSGAADNFDYTYNQNGNRLTADAQTLTFNPANQITSSGFSYDGSGNQKADPTNGVTAVTYTAADQPKTVTKGGVNYSYTHADANSMELTSQTSPDGNYRYAYGRVGPQGVPVIEAVNRTNPDGSGPATAAITSDPVTGQPLMLRLSTDMQMLYVYEGTPGSPIGLITSSREVVLAMKYDPYGTVTYTEEGPVTTTQNPYLFAGTGVQDRTTGWIHYANRYYNPKTGTWTQQDTLDKPLDPGNANRYAYAGGDPVSNIDPTGRDWQHCTADVFGIAAGFVGIAAGAITSEIGVGVAVVVSSGLFAEGAIFAASADCDG